MQDPLYRNDVTHHTMGYTNRQYPMTSYYLGEVTCLQTKMVCTAHPTSCL